MRTSFGEPTIEEAVMMLTMRTGGEFPDCDSNGIPDSLDILEGRIADRNHDGVDDFCDEDRRVQDEAYARTWKDLLFQRDTAHVFVRHLPNEHVWIQYTVPISGSRVTLEVINPRGSRVRTISRGWQPPGAHEVLWDKRDSAGRRVQPDVDYTVRLRQDSRSYSRTTRWRDRK